MNFLERELKKSEKNSSRERAFALSFEKIEEELNSWIQRDKYSNEIIKEIIDNLRKCENSPGDNFLQIVDYTLKALEKIVDSPKKSLVKISEFQEMNKVTTTDFKTMTWLGSKPGKNLAEKIGVKGKVLAPKSIYTIDKKENRIVAYYVKKVLEILELRFLNQDNGDKSKKLQEIYRKFYRIKRKMILNEMFSLKRPLDFIPNNTLIDHRDYSVVNRGLNILKKYMKENEYTEKELLEKSLLVIFINIINRLKELKNIKVLKKIFDIKNIISLKKDSVEYFIESKNFYHLKIQLEDEQLKISLKKLIFNEQDKKVVEDSRVLLNNQIELEISKEYDLEKNLLKFTLFGFPEEMLLNGESLKEIAQDVVEDIVNIVGKDESVEREIKIDDSRKGIYIDLNTPLSFLDDKYLEDAVYSKDLNSFVGVEDYYPISDFENLSSLSTGFYNGENLEQISRYLDKIFEESLELKEEKIGIFSAPEYQDSEVQKDVCTIFNSKLKPSYPIWRSILATYALDEERETQEETIILDLNAIIPSVNIVKKYGNIVEHHPILSEESKKLKEFSLDNFIRNYLYEYLKKYCINLKEEERKNLLASGKLNSVLFFYEKRVFINTEKSYFYIDKDLEVFNKIISEIEKKLVETFREKDFAEALKNKKIIIISEYLSLIFKSGKNKIIMKEVELGKGKDKILKKILSKKTVWNEFLPNLSLQTTKEGHFYSLDLIKDKSIDLTLGEEITFEVEDTLVFPAGQKIITFPLYSEDSLNKKSYFLEVKSSSFPLDEPLEVKLKIGYSYGKENPYRIIVSVDDNQVEFETKWVEQNEEIEKKQINFPDIVIDEKFGEFILDKIWHDRNNNEKLLVTLKKTKNKFRKYLIKKVENEEIDEILNHKTILFLTDLLNSSEIEESLSYQVKTFLASLNNISSIEIDTNGSYQIEKRKFLFNYSYSSNNLRLKSFIDNNETIKIIGIIAEFSWLDRDFIKGVVEKEPKVLEECLDYVKRNLNYTRKYFDKNYDRAYEEKKVWKFTDSIRNFLEFLLAIFLLDKDKNILFNEMKNRKEYLELLYNIKEIDRKIQLETIKYPKLKEEFDNGLRIKIDIGEREGLENVSDLVYTLFNYMTGSDGSDLIKIKEVVEN